MTRPYDERNADIEALGGTSTDTNALMHLCTLGSFSAEAARGEYERLVRLGLAERLLTQGRYQFTYLPSARGWQVVHGTTPSRTSRTEGSAIGIGRTLELEDEAENKETKT